MTAGAEFMSRPRTASQRFERRSNLAAAALVLVLGAGCFVVQPPISHTAAPSPTSGYVGGVFSKDTVVGFGFALRNAETSAEYVLEVEDHGVGLIAVPPGRYHVASWVTWAITGERLTEKAIPGDVAFARTFDVEAGSVVLLGSWSADRDGRTYVIVPHPISEADVGTEFRRAYPQFANTPVYCTFCAP
jgi:hypothetical protein